MMSSRFFQSVALCVLLMLSGCFLLMEESTRVHGTPTDFHPAHDAQLLTLRQEAVAHLGNGCPVTLKANTTWKHIGATGSGEVYSTHDQAVYTGGPAVSDACIVVSNSCIVGLYLPVQQEFCPLMHVVRIEMRNDQ
jgi:hypothetical protein